MSSTDEFRLGSKSLTGMGLKLGKELGNRQVSSHVSETQTEAAQGLQSA
jgi:hypothetical protein